MAHSVQLGVDFGPLEELFADDTVNQIMVNGPYDVYVERRGRKLEKVDLSFEDNEHLMSVIERILSPLGARLDESSPIVVGRFADGSRIHAIIPPLSLIGPTLTIRKFPRDMLTLDNFVEFGTLSEDMAHFLATCVKARLNIIITGGVGAGRTTLLNILASVIPADKRIVTIENVAQLRLRQEHVIALESRPANAEGKGGISIRDLVNTSLHMRPDRILIDELTGPEVLDVLRTMSRGYDGAMATTFANSPQEALENLEMQVRISEPNLPVSYLHSLIGATVDLIVQQHRFEDGTRKVIRVTEVLPTSEGGYDLHDVFVFRWERPGAGKVVGNVESYPVSGSLMRRIEAFRRMGDHDVTLPASLVPRTDDEEESTTARRPEND